MNKKIQFIVEIEQCEAGLVMRVTAQGRESPITSIIRDVCLEYLGVYFSKAIIELRANALFEEFGKLHIKET